MWRSKLILACIALACCATLARSQEDAKPPQRPDQPGNQLFDQLDRNKKGFLEKDDLPERMRERFEVLDANKDGKVSREEFQRGTQFDAGRFFEQLDRTNKGYLEKADLPERLRDRFEFIDVDKDGKVTREEFLRGGRLMAPVPGGAATPPAVLVEGLVRLLDANRDQRLSREELAYAVQLLEKFDLNKDGVLDRQELQAAFARDAARPAGDLTENARRRMREAMEQMDANKDGKISKDEAKGLVKDGFDRLDRNRDGFVDQEEMSGLLPWFNDPTGFFQGQFPRPPDGGSAKPASFDDLDLNADGRLTREELRRTLWATRFEEIDANKDGKIDPKEYEAFVKKLEGKSGG